MKKNFILCLLYVLAHLSALAQSATIKGKIKSSSTGEGVPAVSVMVKGQTAGTYTDDNGSFYLQVASLPVTLIVSSVGFESQELIVDSKENIAVRLVPFSPLGQEVVLSATRTPTRILESPVSIERIGVAGIGTSPTTSYYDLAGYKKGIDLTTSSLTFKTISTRGFNGSGSTRVNQIVDGMDNQAPGLNFFIGSFVGLTELDVESMELLPGASSALYGPGGINGTVLINSKNPFQYQGLSIQAKEGVNHVDKSQRAEAAPFHDFSLRWAKAFNNKLAFKIGAQYIKATDWLASDSSNYLRQGGVGKIIPGNRQTDPNYDGVNVYGDETSINLQDVAKLMIGAGVLPAQALPLVPNVNVSRTGYAEKDMIDPETKNIKLSGALHYKLNPNLEAQLMGYWATGNTIYTGNNRYVLKDIKIGQYKLELKHRDWFLRAYTTQENAGEAYTATVAAQRFNEEWKKSQLWYPQYVGAYATGAAGIVGQVLAGGGSIADAMTAVGAAAGQLHRGSRAYADQGRPEAGSQQFKEIFDVVRKRPIPAGGLFLEKSQLWMGEGQYNLSNHLKIADVIVGANVKQYILDSKGTLFIDTAGAITINELGAYAQATKKLLNEVLTLSVSGRYDRNEDFKGRFTPRATALVRVAKDNNLRFSYQTAYRFPSTQQKYIRLDVGDYTLLGGLPWIMNYMDAAKNPVVELDGGKPFTYNAFKPESMRSFEAGYKGIIAKKLMVDAYGYFGEYRDFLGRKTLYQPASAKIYSVAINSSTRVKTHGFGLSLDYQLPRHFSVFVNSYSDVITDVPSDFQAFFNAPKYRVNAGVANSGMGKSRRFGFNVLLHWQDAFWWDGELANGPLDAFSTVDAQVSYRFPKVKSILKLGGTNVFNTYYKNAYANPEIGGLYYVSIGYNIL